MVDGKYCRVPQYEMYDIDMLADDSSRVVLSVPNTSGTDYINASFVNVSNADTA